MEEIKLQQALDANLIPVPDNRTSFDANCPVCGGKKKMNYNLGKNVCRCNKCGRAFNAVSLHAFLNNIGTKEAYKELMGGNLQPSESKVIPAAPVVKQSRRASTDKIHAVYSSMLLKWKLNGKNRKDLLRRGFRPEEIESLGYGSLPSSMDDLSVKADFIKSLELDDFSGIPGFYVSKKGNWWLKTWKPGTVMPMRNINGKITTLQIRKDDDLIEADEGKCYYITSRDKEAGTEAKQAVHYACDFVTLEDGSKTIDVGNGYMVLTEGVMKADLYHAITGMPTLSIPGVNCLTCLKQELPKIKRAGVFRIRIAYDMDRYENILVLEALEKLKALIRKFDLEYETVQWNDIYTVKDSEERLSEEDDFVILADDDNIDGNIKLLPRIKSLGKKRILFSRKDKDEPVSRESYMKLSAECVKNKLVLLPVIWNLSYKGCDDYVAAQFRCAG